MQEAVAKHEEVVYSKYELVRVVNHDRVCSIAGKHALLNHWHEELEITYNINGRSASCLAAVQLLWQAFRHRGLFAGPEIDFDGMPGKLYIRIFLFLLRQKPFFPGRFELLQEIALFVYTFYVVSADAVSRGVFCE